MNQDQTINLIQTLFKLGSGALVAKGVGDSSLWEGITGAVVAVVTWYLSHRWNATPVQSPTSNVQSPPPTPPMSLGGALHLLLVAGFCGALLAGCTLNQQKVAYNSLYTLEQSTTTALDGYDTLLIQGKVATNGVPAVTKAYNDFQAAFVLALDGAQYNTNAMAPPNLVMEAQDFVNLVTTIKAKGTK